MAETDLSEVIDLQRAGGLAPWPRPDFERELTRPENILLVAEGAEAERRVIGALTGRAMIDEFEIFDVAVAGAWRRQGVGAALVREALAAARRRGAARALLEVRAGNEAAIRLYHRFRFRRSGLRKSYYQHPPEDALVMLCDLQSGALRGAPEVVEEPPKVELPSG